MRIIRSLANMTELNNILFDFNYLLHVYKRILRPVHIGFIYDL